MRSIRHADGGVVMPDLIPKRASYRTECAVLCDIRATAVGRERRTVVGRDACRMGRPSARLAVAVPDADVARLARADVVEAVGHVGHEIEGVALFQIVGLVAQRDAHGALLNQ